MSSGFISETELAERRKARQEEWEKVRQPHQPLEAPEEEYDHRSLYERLQEQKQKKEFEYEEAHRLKNMIKGLDDDEVEFLDLVDRSKLEEERKKTAEEEREMADFRIKVASLQEKSLEERIQQEIRQPLRVNNTILSGRTSQTKLLAGAVVKKRSLEKSPDSKKKPATESPAAIANAKKAKTEPSEPQTEDRRKKRPHCETLGNPPSSHGTMKCIGILPGLGTYENSSEEGESDESSDAEEEQARFDLLGRRIEKHIQVTQ